MSEAFCECGRGASFKHQCEFQPTPVTSTLLPSGTIHKGRTPVVELREVARGLEQYAYLNAGDNLMKAAATRIKEVAAYLENAQQPEGLTRGCGEPGCIKAAHQGHHSDGRSWWQTQQAQPEDAPDVLSLDVVGPIVESAILQTQGKPASIIQAAEIIALELQEAWKNRRPTVQSLCAECGQPKGYVYHDGDLQVAVTTAPGSTVADQMKFHNFVPRRTSQAQDDTRLLECIRLVSGSCRRFGEHSDDRDRRILDTIEGLLDGTVSPELETFREQAVRNGEIL